MKKFISFIIAACLLLTMPVVTCAASDELSFSPQLPYAQHFVKDKTICIWMNVLDTRLFDYEKIIIYIDCNKSVISCVYHGDTGSDVNCLDSTDTGYMLTLYTESILNGCFSSAFYFTAHDFGDPMVNIRAEKVSYDGKTTDIRFSALLPANKVYGEDEIPHLIANLRPPVFGNSVSFNQFGVVYVYGRQKIDGIFEMFSSSDDSANVIYISATGNSNEYVASGDVIALKYEDRYCDHVVITVMGDADLNGIITAADARQVLRFAAELKNDMKNDYGNCDINHDKTINAADARMILRVAAKIDYFRLPDLQLWVNHQYFISLLNDAADEGYVWNCTVSEPDAINVYESAQDISDTSVRQEFRLEILKQGVWEVHFELIRPGETVPVEEFGFNIIVDDVMT